jgi:hypothetical protein
MLLPESQNKTIQEKKKIEHDTTARGTPTPCLLAAKEARDKKEALVAAARGISRRSTEN